MLREHDVHNDDQRMEHIFKRVHKALRDPSYRGDAIKATRRCRARDDQCEINALFNSTKKNLRYVADVRGIDTYQNPVRSRDWGGGDCDDHLADLIAQHYSIGFAAGARVMSPDLDPSGTHTYGIIGVPKEEPTRVVVLDTTVEGTRPGDEPAAGQTRWYRDYWYGEDDRGNPVVLKGASGGVRLSASTVVLIFVFVAGAVTAGVLLWRHRRSA